jgi:Tol biopolymer transport system component
VFSAAWAPRGESILYGNEIVNADGTGRRDVSGAGDEVGSMAWSTDGQHIVVARGPEGSRELWIMDLAGNFLAQVTHDPGTYSIWDWR